MIVIDDGRPEYCLGVPSESLDCSGIAFGGERHTTGPSRELVERARSVLYGLVYWYVDTLHNNAQASRSSHTFFAHVGDGQSIVRGANCRGIVVDIVGQWGECTHECDDLCPVLITRYINRCGRRSTTIYLLGVLAILLAEPSHEAGHHQHHYQWSLSWWLLM